MLRCAHFGTRARKVFYPISAPIIDSGLGGAGDRGARIELRLIAWPPERQIIPHAWSRRLVKAL